MYCDKYLLYQLTICIANCKIISFKYYYPPYIISDEITDSVCKLKFHFLRICCMNNKTLILSQVWNAISHAVNPGYSIAIGIFRFEPIALSLIYANVVSSILNILTLDFDNQKKLRSLYKFKVKVTWVYVL